MGPCGARLGEFGVGLVPARTTDARVRSGERHKTYFLSVAGWASMMANPKDDIRGYGHRFAADLWTFVFWSVPEAMALRFRLLWKVELADDFLGGTVSVADRTAGAVHAAREIG